jgi:capsid protein
MTGDLTQANYSSLRAGRLAFKRRLEQMQWLVLIPRFCEPIKDAFVRAAQVAGLLPLRADGWPVEWGPPRFEMVDPYKDAMALQLMMRLGLKTWGQAAAEEGWDPRAQASELAEWNEEFDRLGLILDGDPRRTAGSGSAQDTRQNAAVELQAEGLAANAPAVPAEPEPAAAAPIVLNLQVDARAGTTSRRVDLARNPDGSLSARMTEEA